MVNLDDYSGKRVLITGGGGFVGSNLAIKLVELGARVRVMDSRLPNHGYNEFNLSPVSEAVEMDFSDIRDLGAVDRNIAGQEIIFNLAAHVGEKNSLMDPNLDYDINVHGHRQFLERVLKINPSAIVVFPGSRLQYGRFDGPMPVSESAPLNPITPYAKNKVLGEQIYLAMHQERGLKPVVFRIANPFGPRALIDNPGYCIVNWFVGRTIKGLDLTVYGEGSQLRDYIFIDDVVEALMVGGLEKKAIGQVFNLGSGVGTAFGEMAQSVIMASRGNTTSKVSYIDWPQDAKERETGDFVADIGKIKKFLGWSPRFRLREGLEITRDFYIKNGCHYH